MSNVSSITINTHSLDPSQMTWSPFEKFCFAMLDFAKRLGLK